MDARSQAAGRWVGADVRRWTVGRRARGGFVRHAMATPLWVVLAIGGCASDGPAAGVRGGSATAVRSPSASRSLAELSALQRAPGYAFMRTAGVLGARVGAGGTAGRVTLEGDRISVASDRGGFVLGLRTARMGRATLAPVPPVGETRADGQELVLVRGPVEERYLTGPLGLEQSYRVDQRPPGSGPLRIEVGFDGLLPATETGRAVELRDAAGQARAVYRDLSAVDATGSALSARMVIEGGSVTLVVDDGGAVYPVTVDPLVAQAAELTASDGQRPDQLGGAVSMSGDTALIGAANRTTAPGAAYVFVNNGTTWTQEAELVASDGKTSDRFGTAVSVSGDTALVSATYTSGGGMPRAYVFVRSGTTWTQQAELFAADGNASDEFGAAVSLSGDTAIVGAPHKGAAYVYVRSGTTWALQTELFGPGGGYYFGNAVSVSSDTAVITRLSAADVFVRAGTTWTKQAELVASDGLPADAFGTTVSVSGDLAVVGAMDKNNNQGAAYVFARSGTTWTQQAELANPSGVPNTWFGLSVAVSGNFAVVGAYGSAFSFSQSGSTWTHRGQLFPTDDPGDTKFGSAVSVAGGTMFVGGPGWNGYQGAVYVYDYPWAQGSPCVAAADCASGFCADGVCCDTACGTTCQACSKAAGGAVDGVCGPVVCAAPDQCHQATTCDPITGTCPQKPARPDGATCDDGNACTQTDTCQGGVCTGGAPVICPTPDPCHTAGTCNPSSGVCSNPVVPDGTLCDTADASTPLDHCQGGVCVPGPPLGTWNLVKPMGTPRFGHTATRLSSGKIFVTGGQQGTTSLGACVASGTSPVTLQTSEIYDPLADTWSPAASSSAAHLGMDAVLLSDGRVMIPGAPSEIYDPASDEWTPSASSPQPITGSARAFLLADGRVLVLVAGASSVQRYDPASDTWTLGAPCPQGTFTSAMARLNDGRLFALTDASSSQLGLIYDPVADQWSATSSPGAAPASAPATTLADGRVFLSQALYDPATDTWLPLPAAPLTPLGEQSGSYGVVTWWSITGGRMLAVLPDSGAALLGGETASWSSGFVGTICNSNTTGYTGLSASAALDAATSTWQPSAALHVGRGYGTVAVLAGGEPMVTGGQPSGSGCSTNPACPASHELEPVTAAVEIYVYPAALGASCDAAAGCASHTCQAGICVVADAGAGSDAGGSGGATTTTTATGGSSTTIATGGSITTATGGSTTTVATGGGITTATGGTATTTTTLATGGSTTTTATGGTATTTTTLATGGSTTTDTPTTPAAGTGGGITPGTTTPPSDATGNTGSSAGSFTALGGGCQLSAELGGRGGAAWIVAMGAILAAGGRRRRKSLSPRAARSP